MCLVTFDTCSWPVVSMPVPQPPPSRCGTSAVYVPAHRRHEAAYKLSGNAEAVAKFACRGAGRGSGWNLLPGRAPLSDPNASPNLKILSDVDYCLRQVCDFNLIAYSTMYCVCLLVAPRRRFTSL